MIKSLERKMIVFLLIPVGAILFLTGFMAFLYARGVIVREWRGAATLKLQRAAHHMDMRLSRPVQWLQMFYGTAEGRGGLIVQEWLIEQLRSMEGVAAVDLQWLQDQPGRPAMGMRGRGSGPGPGAMRFHRAVISEVTSPRVDAVTGRKTVDLVSELKSEAGEVIGILRISLGFDYLMQDILSLGWSEGDQACLVDESGRYLAHAYEVADHHLGQSGDPVEEAILLEMKKRHFGTVLGPGAPPRMVGGFYRLEQAPWTLVVFAPGETILAPMIKFRTFFFLAGLGCILIILFLIRNIVGRMVRSIREIAAAAERVAGGDYGAALQPRSSDEIGNLIQSFNRMVEGLRERDLIGNTFGRYVDQEIAKEILKKPEAGRLGGEKRWVAILMSDIRNFTPLSDSLQPEDTIRILNRYFARMIASIQRHKGIIVDFFGDGILVFFDPLDGPLLPSLRRAVECAFDMQSRMEGFNAEMRAEGFPEFQMGIGLNAGEVVVGNIGSEYRAKYGIVGSAVNVTERIQSLARGGEVVVSETVLSRLQEGLAVTRSFVSPLRGVEGEARLFAVGSTLTQ
jgi:class 3 adenylate cyclase